MNTLEHPSRCALSRRAGANPPSGGRAAGSWIRTLLACRGRNEAAVLVTVASVRGSAPREPGAKMLVTVATQFGTIGGGNLEFQAIGIARDLLHGLAATDGRRGGQHQGQQYDGQHNRHRPDSASISALRRFPLGASLGQCCGGVVTLMFAPVCTDADHAAWLDVAARHLAQDEPCVIVSGAGCTAASGSMLVSREEQAGSLGVEALDTQAVALARDIMANRGGTCLVAMAEGGPLCLFDPVRSADLKVVLFGAGHVGAALAGILGGLACEVTWVDQRAEQFPARVPDNVVTVVSDTPVDDVDAAAPGSYFLVLTHSHALDQALSERILRRDDAAYFGLIGSATKRRQFEHRLAARGITAQQLAGMTCPIGIPGVNGREPAAIAVAVAAQLLQVHDARSAAATKDESSMQRRGDRR